MKIKSRLILLLIALVVLLSSSVVAISFVLASSNQRVYSQIKVTYIASTNIAINVYANKYFKNNTAVPFSGGQDGVIIIDKNSQAEQTLTTTRTDLTNPYYYVVYEYVFDNTGNVDVTASLSVSSLENLKMFVDTSTVQKENIYTEFDENEYIESQTIQSLVIQSGEKKYAYVVISVDRLANDASYIQGFLWTLT